jgi:hypothetical protein
MCEAGPVLNESVKFATFAAGIDSYGQVIKKLLVELSTGE